MRSTSFHLAMRSLRANEPTLSWPVCQPIARCDDRHIFRLAGARGDDAGIPAAWRRASLQRLGQRAALVGLEQHGVGGASAAACRTSGACETSKSSPTICSRCPTARVNRAKPRLRLRQAGLRSNDRILVDPADQHLDQAVGIEFARLQPEPVAPGATELGSRHVECDRDLRAGAESGMLDRRDQHLQRLFVGREVRPPAAFVGDAVIDPRLGASVRRRCDRPRRSTRAPRQSSSRRDKRP